MKNKKLRCIYLDDETWDFAKKMAEKDSRSITNYIEILIKKEKVKNK